MTAKKLRMNLQRHLVFAGAGDGGPGIFSERRTYYFKGANAHQDHAGWGDAVADSGFYRDVSLIKDAASISFAVTLSTRPGLRGRL